MLDIYNTNETEEVADGISSQMINIINNNITYARYGTANIIKQEVLDLFTDDFQRALGVTIKIEADKSFTRYNTIKITIVHDELDENVGIVPCNKGQIDFENNCRRVPEIKKEWYNRMFIYRNKNHRIIGLNPRATSYPVICQCMVTKRKYKFSTSLVKDLILN